MFLRMLSENSLYLGKKIAIFEMESLFIAISVLPVSVGSWASFSQKLGLLFFFTLLWVNET